MGGVGPATLAERSNGMTPTASSVFASVIQSAGVTLPSPGEEGGAVTLVRDITAFGRGCFAAFNRKEEAVRNLSLCPSPPLRLGPSLTASLSLSGRRSLRSRRGLRSTSPTLPTCCSV